MAEGLNFKQMVHQQFDRPSSAFAEAIAGIAASRKYMGIFP